MTTKFTPIESLFMAFTLADAHKVSDSEKVKRAEAFEAGIRKELPSDLVWMCDQITARIKSAGSQLTEAGKKFAEWLEEQEFEVMEPFQSMLDGSVQDAQEVVNDTVASNQIFLIVAVPYAIPSEYEPLNWMKTLDEMERLLSEFNSVHTT